jgi:hypothetical protein
MSNPNLELVINRLRINDQTIREAWLKVVQLQRQVLEEGRSEEIFLELCRIDNYVISLKEGRAIILHEFHQNLLLPSQDQ